MEGLSRVSNCVFLGLGLCVYFAGSFLGVTVCNKASHTCGPFHSRSLTHQLDLHLTSYFHSHRNITQPRQPQPVFPLFGELPFPLALFLSLCDDPELELEPCAPPSASPLGFETSLFAGDTFRGLEPSYSRPVSISPWPFPAIDRLL